MCVFIVYSSFKSLSIIIESTRFPHLFLAAGMIYLFPGRNKLLYQSIIKLIDKEGII
jgi:hypothetical protein